MPKFDTGKPKASNLLPGQFIAKYGGGCAQCGNGFEKGDLCHFIDNKAAHADCHSIDGIESDAYGTGYRRDGANRFLSETPSDDEREPNFVVRGRRKPPLCTACWLEHNGDCP